MHREGLADAFRRHVLRQKRVVGRVVDRVADAGEREQGHQQPERIHQPGQNEGAGADHQAEDEQNARAQPIDQEAGGRLQGGRDDIESGEAQPDLGVAHAVIGAHERQERRQDDDVIVRHEMRRAHRADNADMRRAARVQGFGRLSHACEVSGSGRLWPGSRRQSSAITAGWSCAGTLDRKRRAGGRLLSRSRFQTGIALQAFFEDAGARSTMTGSAGTKGMIAVDKMGAKILFLNPKTYETETVIDGFQRTVHELLVMPEAGVAYVPIFGDGIHGRNPNPGHVLCVIDLNKRVRLADIDLRPYIAPHTLRLAPDGLIYITCENSAVVAIIDPKTNKVVSSIPSGTTNAHRLCISGDGRRIYTDNEEDAEISVIDLPNRKLLGKIKMPQPIAGIAVSPDGRTVVTVSDTAPVLYVVDTMKGEVTREVTLEGVPKAAQIARYSPDGSLLCVTSLNSDMVSVMKADFTEQSAIKIGSQPMDMAFRDGELFVGCQGDGSMHVVDLEARRATQSFKAGTGCESVGFF
jgi:DNA-binding beta-propeller fold protein YncE